MPLTARSLTTICLFSCLIIFLISFSLPQYIQTTSLNETYGLFGANLFGGGYKSYPTWKGLCNDDCKTISGFYNAGSASATFQVLSLIALLLALVLNVLEIFKIRIFNASVFDGKFVTYLSFGVAFLLSFSWILWTLIRPFNPSYYYGFSYNGLLVSISLAALAGVFSIYDDGSHNDQSNSKSGYVSIDDKSEDISYGEIPEGEFSLRKMILFTSWQSPITVRILYYLAMILAICNIITTMVNLNDFSGLPGFFSTLFRVLIYNIVFVGIVRVLGELAMKVFSKYGISNHHAHKEKVAEIIIEQEEEKKEDSQYNNEDLLNTDNESGDQSNYQSNYQSNPNFDDDKESNEQYQQIN